MKSVKTTVCLLLVLVLCAGCSPRVTTKNLNYDNETPYIDLITESYSVDEIDRLLERIYKVAPEFDQWLYYGDNVFAAMGYMTYSELASEFNIQCVRKTFPGQYYAVLLREDGKRVFIFFYDMKERTELIQGDEELVRIMRAFKWAGRGSELIIYGAKVLGSLLSVEDFERAREKEYLYDNIINMDKNYQKRTMSLLISAHIVKEGVINIYYAPNNKISDMKFYKDEDPSTYSSTDWSTWPPQWGGYIYPIDKQDY